MTNNFICVTRTGRVYKYPFLKTNFKMHRFCLYHVDGLVQDRSNSSANALELLQSCIMPSSMLYPFPI